MSTEPESLVLQLLRGIRADMADMGTRMDDMRAQMATKDDLTELRDEFKSDMHSLRADFASDLLTFRKEMGEQIVGLRRAVIEYHTTVIGHGILISDLEGRVRRIEQHLDLPSADLS